MLDFNVVKNYRLRRSWGSKLVLNQSLVMLRFRQALLAKTTFQY